LSNSWFKHWLLFNRFQTDEKIDKKKLALEVLGLVFPGLTVTDLNLYGQQIEFLLDNEIIRAKAKTTIIKIYHKVCKLKCLSKKKKK
jgi:hypothetical protein